MDPLHVILDLDETLIHSTNTPLDGLEHDFVIDPDDSAYLCHLRPGAVDFIAKLMNDPRFAVGVYTAATADYAEVVINRLFGEKAQDLQAVLTRDKTTTRRPGVDRPYLGGWDIGISEPHMWYQEKDLKKYRRKTGCKRERVIALDDSPIAWSRSYGNLLSIPAFTKLEKNDRMLVAAYMALEKLSLETDVRLIEKRGLILSMAKKVETNLSYSF